MAGLQIEVEEPDLSMELMGQLRGHLSALEADYMKEVRKEGSEAPAQASHCAEKYSDLAAAEIACMLQSFNPEISEEDLARDVHSIIHTQSVVGHLHPPMLTALRECVPLDRRAWFANDIPRHLLRQRRRRPFRKVLQIFRQQSEDRKVQVTVLSAFGGAAVGSTGGGALGLIAGGSFGAACGLLPAMLTFGISIPLGVAVGGTCGLITGAAAGGTAGLVSGGLVGHGYAHRLLARSVSEASKFSGHCSIANWAWTRRSRGDGTGGTH